MRRRREVAARAPSSKNSTRPRPASFARRSAESQLRKIASGPEGPESAAPKQMPTLAETMISSPWTTWA